MRRLSIVVDAQSPVVGGSAIAEGTTVSISISTGGVVVPSVLGRTPEVAQGMLTSAGLVPKTLARALCLTFGEVQLQSPHADEVVPAGTTVTITWDNGTKAQCGIAP
jgi:beta-lactam-binding protein with PASTA domain